MESYTQISTYLWVFTALTQFTKEARTPFVTFLSSSAPCNLIFLSDITPNSTFETFLQPLAGQTFRLFCSLQLAAVWLVHRDGGKRDGCAGGNGEGILQQHLPMTC